MPFNPRMPEDGESGFYEAAQSAFQAVNEQPNEGDWQIPDPSTYTSQSQSSPKITVLGQGGGRATVRINAAINYNVGNFIVGTFSGTIAAGSTMSGSDSNGNGIPDLLEKCLKARDCTFAQ